MATHSKKKKTKQLLSHSDRQNRKQKKKQQTLSLILVFLMLGSIFAIWATSNSNNNNDDMRFGDYKFTVDTLEGSTNYVVVTNVNGDQVYFYTLPRDARTVSIQGNLTKSFEKAQYITISSYPLDDLATYYDLIRYDLSTFSQKTILGATNQSVEGITLPVVTCANATTYTPVIELSASNSTQIIINGSCIRAEFTQGDVAIMRDRLLYSLLEILNE